MSELLKREIAEVRTRYALIASVAGDEAKLAWLTMWYACSDKPTPARPVPPDWDDIVARAPEGYWEERGGVPETYTGVGQRWFRGKPGGCGWERLVYVCVGVEGPKWLTCTEPQYPHTGECKLSRPAVAGEFFDVDAPEAEYVSGHALWIASPFVAGRCVRCGLPLTHVRWQDDLVFEEFVEVPRGFAFFRIPPTWKWDEWAAKGYGGAELVEPFTE